MNISKEADNFNVVRRLTVINARTDSPMFELVGAFSLLNNDNDELVITCQTGPNEFKKHYVYLNKEMSRGNLSALYRLETALTLV